MMNPNSASHTETYSYTAATVNVDVMASVTTTTIERARSIASYFIKDLKHFTQITHINLARELHVPRGYPRSTEILINQLYEDLARMVRDELITGIHLLLSEPQPDPTRHAYRLRYHAEYSIHLSRLDRKLKPQTNKPTSATQFGGSVAPPKDIWQNARFALLIDWNQTATLEMRRQARRPLYCFNWVPEQARFDATSLVRYRQGVMSCDGARIDRDEYTTPRYQ